jgi:beta-glucosidase
MQEQLAIEIAGTGKPIIVVLVTGRPYAIPWLAEHCSAILEAWLPGEEGGAAVAETLFGDANPGGKLPITFPRGVGQVPIYYSSSASGTKSFWYDDYVNEKTTPLYPFGHGLSYTTLVYEDLKIDRQTATKGESVHISLQLTNRGPIEGDEVVQLYISDEYGCVPRPVKELKGFIRVTLKPGESRYIHFHLPVDQLAFYNNDLELVLEPGRIKVMIGSSSEDIRLSGEFQVLGAQKMVIRNRVWCCPVEVD